MIRFPICVALLVACSSSAAPRPTAPSAPPAKPEPAPPPEEPAPEPPYLRLGDDARPTRYAAELWLDADKDGFKGRVSIAVTLARPTDFIWLNAKAITIESATMTSSYERLAAKVFPSGDEHVGFRFPKPIPAGAQVMEIEYSGRSPDENHEGVFRDEDRGRWYLYTQFEPFDARRAFPCFDEPAFKVPWQLTIHVPEGQQAYSNTPGTRTVAGGVATHVFAETKPLPTYLVAFAVGPFEEVAIATDKVKTPLRLLVPAGRRNETGYAVEATPILLALLEEYFGTPYPYEKLDVVAVPSFPGAMENAGLITFNLGLLLRPDDEWTIATRRGMANIMAHEIGHQWFGDLVTMVWWDDIWLNEAFATWIAAKVVDQWKPEWDGAVEALDDREVGLGADGLTTARRIRQPIEVMGDIAGAFDAITYRKGAAVLRMFEAELGVETFRNGVRAYLARHAWKNATSADFLAALDEAAPGKDISKRFSAYLDQAGAPLVGFQLECQKGAPPKLALTQTRFVPLGSQSDGTERWPVRVCVRYPAGKTAESACTLLTDAAGELSLPAAKKCPKWFVPNVDGVGYYRSRLGAAQVAKLLDKGAKQSTIADRVGAMRDVGALVGAGHLPASEALALVPAAAKAKQRHLLDATISIVGAAGELMLPDDLRPNFARFVRKVYGERARSLGWKGKGVEDDDTKLLRTSLVALVAAAGEDEELTRQARDLAAKWLDDPSVVDANVTESMLVVAARSGDRALWDRLRAAADKATEQRERVRLVAALGAFHDPALAEEARKLSIGADYGIFESIAILAVQLSDPKLRDAAYEFTKNNLDVIAGKLPIAFRAYIVQVGAAFCDEAHRADVDGWFREKAKDWPGADRAIAQTLEMIDQCIARRKAQEADLRAFLGKY